MTTKYTIETRGDANAIWEEPTLMNVGFYYGLNALHFDDTERAVIHLTFLEQMVKVNCGTREYRIVKITRQAL